MDDSFDNVNQVCQLEALGVVVAMCDQGILVVGVFWTGAFGDGVDVNAIYGNGSDVVV